MPIQCERVFGGRRIGGSMFCTTCGSGPSSGSFCTQCGSALKPSTTPSTKPQQSLTFPPLPPPPIPPIPPPPPGKSSAQASSPFESFDASPAPQLDPTERLAQTGKVVGLTGCGLALLFWIIIPLVFVLIAIAATSSTGLAVVALTVGLIVAFIRWVWRRTGT
jgi:hypothetical protein